MVKRKTILRDSRRFITHGSKRRKHSEVLDEIDLQINHYRRRIPHIDAGADWQTSNLLSDCQTEPTFTTCLGSLDFMPRWGEVRVQLKVYNKNVEKKEEEEGVIIAYKI